MTDTKNKTNKTTKQNKFVVLRDGRRVSEAEYPSQELASSEYSYWRQLVNKWDPTSTVEICEKDDKKHRVY